MYKWLISIFIAIITTVAIVFALPFQNKTTLTWTAPTTNVDGTPITDLGGYKLYWSSVSGVYDGTKVKDVGNVLTANTLTSVGVLKGNWCFVITAYDTTGNESDFSNEACASFTLKKKPPTNLGLN